MLSGEVIDCVSDLQEIMTASKKNGMILIVGGIYIWLDARNRKRFPQGLPTLATFVHMNLLAGTLRIGDVYPVTNNTGTCNLIRSVKFRGLIVVYYIAESPALELNFVSC